MTETAPLTLHVRSVGRTIPISTTTSTAPAGDQHTSTTHEVGHHDAHAQLTKIEEIVEYLKALYR